MNFIKTHAQLIAACAYLVVVLGLAFFGDLAVPVEQWDSVATAGWALVPLFLCYLMFRGAQYLAALAGVADANMWQVRTETKQYRRNCRG